MLSRDAIVLQAFISSRVADPVRVDELDISAEYTQFEESGLKLSSRCRLSRMTTLSLPLVRRRIGHLQEDLGPHCVQILLSCV